MKKWKKRTLGTVLSAGTVLGGGRYAIHESNKPDENYLSQLGYNETIYDRDTIIANAEKLHRQITSGVRGADWQDGLYGPGKVPYGVARITPERFIDCRLAGLNATEIKNVLPYDENALGLILNSGYSASVDGQIMSSRFGNVRKWLSHPGEMLDITVKSHNNPQCADDIARLRESRNSAIYNVAKRNAAARQSMELDADKAGAGITSPQSMMNGIIETTEEARRASTFVNGSDYIKKSLRLIIPLSQPGVRLWIAM